MKGTSPGDRRAAPAATARTPGTAVAPPQPPSFRDVLFVGWVGPIASAALYYAALSEEHFQADLVWHAVTLIIVGSTLVHGGTAAAGTRLYGRLKTQSRLQPAPGAAVSSTRIGMFGPDHPAG